MTTTLEITKDYQKITLQSGKFSFKSINSEKFIISEDEGFTNQIVTDYCVVNPSSETDIYIKSASEKSLVTYSDFFF